MGESWRKSKLDFRGGVLLKAVKNIMLKKNKDQHEVYIWTSDLNHICCRLFQLRGKGTQSKDY